MDTTASNAALVIEFHNIVNDAASRPPSPDPEAELMKRHFSGEEAVGQFPLTASPSILLHVLSSSGLDRSTQRIQGDEVTRGPHLLMWRLPTCMRIYTGGWFTISLSLSIPFSSPTPPQTPTSATLPRSHKPGGRGSSIKQHRLIGLRLAEIPCDPGIPDLAILFRYLCSGSLGVEFGRWGWLSDQFRSVVFVV